MTMLEEQRLKLVNTTEPLDEAKKPEMLYPNEYTLARENPFQSLSWQQWEELQATVVQSLNGFLLAAERLLPQMLILHVLSLQEVALELYKEACLWVAPLSQSAREYLRECRTRRGVQNDSLGDPDISAEDECDGSRPSPFYSIRWLPWCKLQAAMLENLSNFLLAAIDKEPDHLMHCVVTLQELVVQCQQEADYWMSIGVVAMARSSSSPAQ